MESNSNLPVYFLHRYLGQEMHDAHRLTWANFSLGSLEISGSNAVVSWTWKYVSHLCK